MEATTSSFRYPSRVVTPADIVLTPVILLGAFKKLPTAVIENAVEALIFELDYREVILISRPVLRRTAVEPA